MRTLSSTLLAAQKASTIDALAKIQLTYGASSYTYDRTRILKIEHNEEPYTHNATVVLDNSDGALTSLDLKGFKAVLSKGAVTGEDSEEQTSTNGFTCCVRPNQARIGQRLTINGRWITKVTFWLRKIGNPSGDLYLRIRKVSDDSIMHSQVWLDVSSLTTSFVWKEVTLTTPLYVNEEVRICAECGFSGNDSNYIQNQGDSSNPKAGECYSYYTTGWNDISAADMCYKYTYQGGQYSSFAPLWVISQRLDSAEGVLVCQLELWGIPELLAEDRASESYVPDEDDTKTVKTLINEIAGATLSCFSGCTAYDVVWDSEDSLIDTYKPKDSFRIYEGGSRLAAIRRLLDYTYCVPRYGADGKIHILKPTTTGTTYDYEYTLSGGHTFFSKAYRKRLVIPNYIIVHSHPDDDPQYSGYAQDAESFGKLPKRRPYSMRLESNAQATDIAEAILSKYQLNADMGAANVPINVGAEIFDYVKVTDSRENDYRVGNLGHITRRYQAGRGRSQTRWEMDFTFGGWLTVRKLLNDLEVNSDIGSYFARLWVKDLYAENIMADNLDMVWLDPEGNIDLSLIGDDLDNLPDGELYARVKSLHLDAGQLRLDENVFYKSGYDPSTKTTVIQQATAPSSPETGDLWLDTSVTPHLLKRWNGLAWVKADPEDIDDLPDGTTYRRTKSAALTADGLVILDSVVVGTYGLVKETDIQAGHIKLSTCYGDLDDIDEGSTYGRLKKTDIDSGHIKLTSYVEVSGQWYNQNGVIIDAVDGIEIRGGKLVLADSGGGHAYTLYVATDGHLHLDNWSYVEIYHAVISAALTVHGFTTHYDDINMHGNYIYGIHWLGISNTSSSAKILDPYGNKYGDIGGDGDCIRYGWADDWKEQSPKVRMEPSYLKLLDDVRVDYDKREFVYRTLPQSGTREDEVSMSLGAMLSWLTCAMEEVKERLEALEMK